MIKEQGSFIRECGENYGGDYGRRSSYEAGNRALGVIGTVAGGLALLSIWNRNGGGIGNLLGGGGSSSGVPTNVNINGGIGGGCVAPTTFEVYQHECDDVLKLTNTLWGQKVNTLELLAAQRNTDIAEKFGLYQSQITADFNLYKDNRDNIDRVNNRINDELFSQYKYTRDKDDEIKKELSDLKAQVAINSAVRPYQDKILTSEIEKVYTAAINYVDRRLCRVPQGVVVLPNTEVTGFGCGCNNGSTTTPAAGA